MGQPSDLDDILAAARRLPRKAQVELVKALLHEDAVPAGDEPLETLGGMSETELRTLAGAVVVPGRQRRMSTLLRKNARGELKEAERGELDALLEEVDRVALLKARASYTLARLGRTDLAAA